MVWNYHDDDVPTPAAEAQVVVAGVPAGVKRVLVEHFRVDETHSNSYTVWKAMGSPARPTQEQEVKLKAAGQLEMMGSPKWVDVNAGEVRICDGDAAAGYFPAADSLVAGLHYGARNCRLHEMQAAIGECSSVVVRS